MINQIQFLRSLVSFSVLHIREATQLFAHRSNRLIYVARMFSWPTGVPKPAMLLYSIASGAFLRGRHYLELEFEIPKLILHKVS